MMRNRLAAFVDHDPAIRPLRTYKDRDLEYLAKIGHRLAALPRPELDGQVRADMRAALVTAAVRRQEAKAHGTDVAGPRPAGMTRRLRLWIAAWVAFAGLTVAGVSFASDPDFSNPGSPHHSFGPVVPTTGLDGSAAGSSEGQPEEPEVTGEVVPGEPSTAPGGGPTGKPGASAGASAGVTIEPPPAPNSLPTAVPGPSPTPSSRGGLLGFLDKVLP